MLSELASAALSRLEDASMNAWPGLTTLIDDGWVIRFGDGYTKRANSISILRAGEDIGDRLSRACFLFERQGLKPCARVLDDAGPSTVAALDQAGFGPAFDGTATLWRDLSRPPGPAPAVVLWPGTAPVRWLQAKDQISGESQADNAARRRILAAIAIPTAFAAAQEPDGEITAVAYGALDRDIISLNMVATGQPHRGQGLAGQVCNALMAWAFQNGARRACLQVLETNSPALKLYGRLGFKGPAYSYRYRMRP